MPTDARATARRETLDPRAPVQPSRLDRLASDVDGRLAVELPPQPSPAVRDPSWPLPRRVRKLPVGWPIAVAVAGWPLWWALGLANVVFPLAALPLAWELHRRGRVRLPPLFWLWVLFLVLVAVSVLTLDVDAVGAATSEGIGRYLAFALRLVNYLAVTVLLVFLGNTTEAELPRRRVISWMASLAVACVLLGVLALLLPDFGFTSPASHVIPAALRGESTGRIELAQMQPVLGDVAPRPAAPFPFTNAWGNNLSLLLPWLVVSWGVLGTRRRRTALVLVLVLAVPPVVFSLNRGVWLGIAISVVVVSVRLALRGRIRALAALVVAVGLGGAAFVATPLEGIVAERIETGHSNDVRGSLLESAIDAAEQSPVIGFGSTRQTIGTTESIAIGPSPDCPQCGYRNIGSTGHLTLLLISQGFLGAALYFGFLAGSALRYGRDRSALGIAATLVVGLHIFYGLFYAALVMPLAITLLSLGLLWRNDLLRRGTTP